MPTPPVIAVVADPPGDAALSERARALADRLGLPTEPDDAELLLTLTPEQLELRVVRGEPRLVGGRPILAQPHTLDTRSGPGRSLRLPLLKALGIRRGDPYRPSVIDATAGLGGDTWLLAAHGCTVTALERSPIIHALLQDGLRRAATLAPDIAQRITLHLGNARTLLTTLPKSNVVLLDPMFPAGRKTAEKKPMRVLRRVVGDDGDDAALLSAALRAAGRRVVVKRPLRAPPLGEADGGTSGGVTVSHKGKALRFDVYAVG